MRRVKRARAWRNGIQDTQLQSLLRYNACTHFTFCPPACIYIRYAKLYIIYWPHAMRIMIGYWWMRRWSFDRPTYLYSVQRECWKHIIIIFFYRRVFHLAQIPVVVSKKIETRLTTFYYSQAVWVFSLIDYEPPHYTRSDGKYMYPWWAEAIGWGIASLSIVCIPAFAIYVFVQAEGTTFTEVSMRVFRCNYIEIRNHSIHCKGLKSFIEMIDYSTNNECFCDLFDVQYYRSSV